MAAVDFCPPVVTAQVPAAPTSEFSCAACNEQLASATDQRLHWKSERHVYNTKRRQAGLKPIPQEAWERKLRESRGADAAGAHRGTAHLKAGKVPRKGIEDGASAGAGAGGHVKAPSSRGGGSEAPTVRDEDDVPFAPEHCLFDRRRFGSIDECLAYMWKSYCFSVPDREYCQDLPGLLTFLWGKISEPPHACLFCNRKFPDGASVRRHMIDKNHTRIGTEARTRRGHTDEASSEELRAELEDFYDFHGSTREITERIWDPRQKVASLLRYFDADRDGRLRYEELAQLWTAATSGGELAAAQYAAACAKAGVDPEEGLDADALGQLYAEGLADLNEHFAMLQDRLAQKRPSRSRAGGRSKSSEGGNGQDVEEVCEEDTADSDGEDDASSADSSETEVVECEDEDEFEEVMRVLGLQPATLLDNGDLRLPNGATAVHREIAYIWRQRGQRVGQLALPSGRPSRRSQLMLSNTTAGCSKIAVSRREHAREGKKIIAVLRQKQRADMKLGMQANMLQTRKPVRTAFGDASGGR